MSHQIIYDQIFHCTKESEGNLIMEIFRFQYQHNKVYQEWCNCMQQTAPTSITTIPFLPISFFKTHCVASTQFAPEMIFESSGTTQITQSKHFIRSIELYKKSFLTGFQLFYGDVKNWCVLGLLPTYLERKNSSLVVMVNELIQQTQHINSGFYLHDFEKLHNVLLSLEKQKQPTLLIGVTFALLDFAEQYNMNLSYTTIIETGGMKGRREEQIRNEIHTFLQQQFGVPRIHSEYGMTELLAQAYSKEKGIFNCPPWMRVFVRDKDDPLIVRTSGAGVLNIIDLSNLYSCAFIATDDVGIVYPNGSFEVQGRLDSSDLRGCSLLGI